MTAGAGLPADRGFRVGRYGTLCSQFEYQGKRYTLTGLYHDRAVPHMLRSVFLTANRPLPEELLLWVGDSAGLWLFRFGEATSQGTTRQWSRLPPALSWADGAQLLVRLTKAVGVPGRVPGVTVAEQVAALTVGWEALPGAERYRVQWKSGSQEYSAARQEEVAWNAPLQVAIPNPEAGVAYTVRVRAINTEGTGPPVEATGTPQVARPPEDGTFWAATLTAAVHESVIEGTQTGFSAHPTPFGHLVPLLFTHAGVTHTIQRLAVQASGELVLWSNTALPTGLTLQVGAHTFSTSTATPHWSFDRHLLIWSSSGVDWTAGETVAVRLTGSVTPPGPPQYLWATADGQHTIHLEWLPPRDDGGSVIIGYQLQESRDGHTWRTVEKETPELTYTATGLPAGSTVHYRVAARSGADSVGPYSQPAQATTVVPPSPSFLLYKPL